MINHKFSLLFVLLISGVLISCVSNTESTQAAAIEEIPAKYLKGNFQDKVFARKEGKVVILLNTDCGACVVFWNNWAEALEPVMKEYNMYAEGLAFGREKHLFDLWLEDSAFNGSIKIAWLKDLNLFASNPQTLFESSQILLLDHENKILFHNSLQVSKEELGKKIKELSKKIEEGGLKRSA